MIRTLRAARVLVSTVTDVLVLAAEERRRERQRVRFEVKLTPHEHRCVMRYRGRGIAKRLGVE